MNILRTSSLPTATNLALGFCNNKRSLNRLLP